MPRSTEYALEIAPNSGNGKRRATAVCSVLSALSYDETQNRSFLSFKSARRCDRLISHAATTHSLPRPRVAPVIPAIKLANQCRSAGRRVSAGLAAGRLHVLSLMRWGLESGLEHWMEKRPEFGEGRRGSWWVNDKPPVGTRRKVMAYLADPESRGRGSGPRNCWRRKQRTQRCSFWRRCTTTCWQQRLKAPAGRGWACGLR